MSWITDLADKAENILNKIDKNAATALQTETVPASLDAMKKSFTSSTQSLKTSLSPVRRTHSPMSLSMSNSVSSLKSEGGHVIDIVPNSTPTTAESPSKTNNMDAQELGAFKIALSEITNERDELRNWINELNHDTEHYELKQKIQVLETLTQNLTIDNEKANEEVSKAQTAQMVTEHSIAELEANLAKLQQEYMSTCQKLQMQSQETEQYRVELQEYRTKAQRALQSKDAVIAQLKSNPKADDNNQDVDANESESRFLQIEYDALKEELQHANEEITKLRLQLDESMVLDRQNTQDLSSARHREETVSKELRVAREHIVTLESEQRMLTQEVSSLRQQLSNNLAASATRLQEKEQQLQILRHEQVTRFNPEHIQSTKDDYENRLKALTQSLVERQGLLERITAERNALSLQYEKVQNQMQQIMHHNHERELESQRGRSRNPLLSNSTDDVKAQFPRLMHPSPFDNRVARRVKRAYSSLDSAGIRLGAFLRRYPLMRISVIVYVALLHLWVILVLLSTTPN